MRLYDIYKRGNVYRLARPTLFNWHWYTTWKGIAGRKYVGVFEAKDFEIAHLECLRANKELAVDQDYKHSKWERVATGWLSEQKKAS